VVQLTSCFHGKNGYLVIYYWGRKGSGEAMITDHLASRRRDLVYMMSSHHTPTAESAVGLPLPISFTAVTAEAKTFAL